MQTTMTYGYLWCITSIIASWFALGWPAFIGVMIIFYLMVAKPKL